MAMRLCEPSVLMATGKRRDDAVDGGLLEEQRLAAAGLFHFAVGDLGDLQFGGDGLGDAFEFARLIQCVDEITERIESHGRKLAEQGEAETQKLGRKLKGGNQELRKGSLPKEKQRASGNSKLPLNS
jgi:hypothetical protein